MKIVGRNIFFEFSKIYFTELTYVITFVLKKETTKSTISCFARAHFSNFYNDYFAIYIHTYMHICVYIYICIYVHDCIQDTRIKRTVQLNYTKT